MDIKLLRTFVTVAQFGNLTKAAEVLHVTQPTISGQIKNMEHYLGLKLFSRTTSSVVVTQAGQELLPKAVKTLEAFGVFTNSAKSLVGTISGKLKIGVVMLDPELLKLGDFMREMVHAHKALSIDLQVARISYFIAGIQTGELDGALYTGNTFPDQTSGRELTRVAFRIAAPASWRVRVENATWADLELLPWIRTTKPSAHDEMLSEIFKSISINPVAIVEADHESIMLALVSAGVGIGLIREDLAVQAEAAGDVIILGQERAHTTLSFIYHSAREHDLHIQAVLAALGKVWGFTTERSQ